MRLSDSPATLDYPSLAVKTLSETEESFRVGGYLVVYDSPAQRDLPS